jgi:DNA-directed RNA polymerase I subunit RPA1
LDRELLVAIRLGRTSGEDRAENSTAKIRSAKDVADALDKVLRSHQPPTDSTSPSTTKLNSFERNLRKELAKAVLTACKGVKRCAHCGAYNPKIRQDSFNKLFQGALSATSLRANSVENVQFTSALIQASNATSDRGTNYDSDDTDRGENTMSGNEDSDSEDDEDDDEVANGTKPKKSDMFMHAGEVQAQIKRTWQTDPFLLHCVFGGSSQSLQDGYQLFFLQAVPVPPSRFRPAMYLNGMAVEHSQTSYLSQMIRFNESIRESFAASDEPRAYSGWIDLQTAATAS